MPGAQPALDNRHHFLQLLYIVTSCNKPSRKLVPAGVALRATITARKFRKHTFPGSPRETFHESSADYVARDPPRRNNRPTADGNLPSSIH